MILAEFGLDPDTGHIINGHTPVKARKGESPVKAGGRLFVIDGGFCKAYQKTTGIAGYTLIYSSHGIRLKSHRPFEGVAKVLSENADMESDSVSIEEFPRRRYIADTDEGDGPPPPHNRAAGAAGALPQRRADAVLRKDKFSY